VSEPALDLVLDPPIKVGGKTYDGLHLREPTARMVARAEKELGGGVVTLYTLRRYQIALLSRAAGVPRAVILAMPVRQLIDAMSFLTAFIAPPDAAQPAKTRRGTKRRARKAAPQ
jgi:hypothetical protein